MEEKDKGGSRGPAIVFVIIALLVFLLALYVLSSGPATWLVTRGYMSSGLDNAIYIPLRWTCDRCEPFSDLIDWYNSFFVALE